MAHKKSRTRDKHYSLVTDLMTCFRNIRHKAYIKISKPLATGQTLEKFVRQKQEIHWKSSYDSAILKATEAGQKLQSTKMKRKIKAKICLMWTPLEDIVKNTWGYYTTFFAIPCCEKKKSTPSQFRGEKRGKITNTTTKLRTLHEVVCDLEFRFWLVIEIVSAFYVRLVMI